MSGVEIAAVVLRTFPTLLQGANALYPVFQGTKDWFAFEETYRKFISDVRAESVFYKQNLEIFLSPFGLDLEEQGSMHQNANSPLWYDHTIRNKIRLRMQNDDFDWFLAQLRTIENTLKALYGLLPKQGEKLQTLDTGTIEYEMNRLKVSFSTDRQPLVDMLKSTNSKINNFVKNETLIDHSLTSKNTNVYKTLQKQARSLHAGIYAGLGCAGPPHEHQCALMIDWPSPSGSLKSPHLMLLLGESSSWKLLRCSMENVKTAERIIPEQIAVYDVQLRAQKWRGELLDAAKSHKIGIATVSATSSFLNPKGTNTEKIWQERETRKLKSKKATRASVSSLKSASRLSLSSIAANFKNPIRDVATQPPSTLSLPVVAIPTAVAPSNIEAAAEPEPRKQVRFEEEQYPNSTIDLDCNDSIPIVDLCAFLTSSNDQSGRKHLEFEQDHLYFEIDPPRQATLKEATMTDLKSVFTTLPRLPDRLQIGIDLIRMILIFGTSGWVPQDWDRQHISILQQNAQNQQLPYPCLSHSAFCKTPPFDLNEDQTKTLLFSIGVLLLELTDNKTLEQTEEWATHSITGLQHKWVLRCAAEDWHDRMRYRYDESLSEPIRRCLNYGFTKVANLEDTGLLEEIADGVLKPLEAVIKRWQEMEHCT